MLTLFKVNLHIPSSLPRWSFPSERRALHDVRRNAFRSAAQSPDPGGRRGMRPHSRNAPSIDRLGVDRRPFRRSRRRAGDRDRLRLSAYGSAGRADAEGMGPDPRGPRVHAGSVCIPRPPRGTLRPRRPGVRRQHGHARGAARGGRAAPSSLRAVERYPPGVVEALAPPDLRVPRPSLPETAHARSRGRPRRQGVLSGVSAGSEPRGSDRVSPRGTPPAMTTCVHDDFAARSFRSFGTSPPASRISRTFGGRGVNRVTTAPGRWISPRAMSISTVSPVFTFSRRPGHSITGNPRLIAFRKKMRANEFARITEMPRVLRAIGAGSRLEA